MTEYIIKEVRAAENMPHILSLLERNLRRQSREWFEWKYLNSIYGEARCWLAIEKNLGVPVGTGALFPRRLSYNGIPFDTAVAGDFAVDSRHRAFGPAIQLQKTIQDSLARSGYKFIYSVPNEHSQQLFLRIGYSPVGKLRKYVKVLKTRYRKDKLLPPQLITSRIAPVLDSLLSFVSREKGYKRPEGLRVEAPLFFDESFDFLWNHSSSGTGFSSVRSSAYLNWRYINSPVKNYRIFSVREGEVLVGYAVYFIERNMAHIMDFFLRDREYCDLLFSEFIIAMRRQGFGSISLYYLGNDFMNRKLDEYGFLNRKIRENRLILYMKDPPEHCIGEEENWYFLMGENDV